MIQQQTLECLLALS